MPHPHGPHVLATAACFVAFAALAFAEDSPPTLRNGSFEEGGRPPAGWEMFEGATNGPAGDSSEVAIDTETVRHGRAALRLSGGAGTTSWQLVRQRIPVPAGHRVTIRVQAKSVAVRKEGAQYPNANALLEFVKAGGERVQMLWTPTLTGDHDWTELRLTGIAPAETAAAWCGLFLSQSGTLWFDDVRADVAPATLADAVGRAAAIDAIEQHLRATYPYFAVNRRPAADAFFAAARTRLSAAKDEDGFVTGLRAVLGDLDDLHIWLRRAGKAISTAPGRNTRTNFDGKARDAALAEVVEGTAPFVVGRLRGADGAPSIGYIEIPTWQLDDAGAAKLEAHIESLAECRALVLDVRANLGGDEAVAGRIASRFAAADVVYARTSVRDAWRPLDPAAMTAPVDRVLAARKGARADARPVVVLQGGACMSSCEGFLLMCRALPGVTTVGDRTRGSSGNPRPFVVVPDLVLHSSTWQTFAPDGTAVDGAGVAPEVAVPDLPAKGRDPVLAKAVELLSK